jgi:UDP-N-acetylmuramoyl-L-alanyl-D-glutamate--2,6-diaminopimelate ligase
MNTGNFHTNLRAFSLKRLLPEARSLRSADLQFLSCCGHWRDCQPGDLYVCLDCGHEDGHDFVQQAIERGAIGVVTERLLAIDAPQFMVEDSRIAYGTICHALAGDPSQRIRTIGVSGTDGKTVTGTLIQSIFQAAGILTAAATSIHHDRFRDAPEIQNPIANAPTLATWLAGAVLDDCSHAVLEISSLALAQHALAGVSLDAVVLNNIRRDHIHYHGSVQNYRSVQSRIVNYLKPEGMVVLNADDPNCRQLLDELTTPALTIGIHQTAEITAKLMDRDRFEQMFLLTAGNDSAIVRTPMIGKHHVYNCLAAAAIGLAHDIDLGTIVRGLEAVGQIPGRLERVDAGQAFDLRIDRAERPHQLATAIHAVQQLTNGRVWVVASVSDRMNVEELRRLGEVLECSADVSILTQSQYPAKLDYRAGHQVLDGFSHPEKAVLIPNRFRAIEWALQNAKAQDSVLIAGCGEQPIAMLGSEPWEVTDREVCEAWFAGHCHGDSTRSPGDDDPPIYRLDDYR